MYQYSSDVINTCNQPFTTTGYRFEDLVERCPDTFNEEKRIEDVDRIEKHLDTLTAEERKILEMRYYDDMKVEDIRQELQIPRRRFNLMMKKLIKFKTTRNEMFTKRKEV